MKTLFQQLGAHEKETTAFLKMLELGAQPVSIIAKHVGVPRTSMYVILEKLKQLSLIETFERNGITYFKCIPVKNIADLLKAKQKHIKQTLEILDEKLPHLIAKENKLSITPHVIFIEGKQGVMQMYEEVLKEKEFFAAFNPELVKRVMPEYINTVGESLKAKGGKANELLVDSREARTYKTKFQSSAHLIKILPPHVHFPSDIIIGKSKIYMISYGEKTVSAIEIIHSSLAQTQRVLFKELWDRI